LSKMLV